MGRWDLASLNLSVSLAKLETGARNCRQTHTHDFSPKGAELKKKSLLCNWGLNSTHFNQDDNSKELNPGHLVDVEIAELHNRAAFSAKEVKFLGYLTGMTSVSRGHPPYTSFFSPPTAGEDTIRSHSEGGKTTIPMIPHFQAA